MSAGVKIFAGSGSQDLAKKIASAYGGELGRTTKTVFSDGEFVVYFDETVRGQTVFIVQSTMPPVENLMELLLMGPVIVALGHCRDDDGQAQVKENTPSC